MIKRYNEITGQWEVIGSANAGSIKLDNPEFSKPSGDPVTVSEGFSALTEDLELVKANIAWLFKNSTSPGIIDTITPHIKDDVWWIGPVDTGIPARGKSPEFRKGDTGIEWRYQGESDWTVLVLFEDLIFKFSDLTPEQIDQLRLKYEDLTPEQIAELQKPANDMIVVLEQTNTTIQAAENSRVTEWARIKSEAEDATEISKEATQESKDATAASEAATIASQTATANANQATTAANTATGLANTATTNANLAAQEARDAAAAVEDGKTPVLQIGNVQKGTTAAADLIPLGPDPSGNPIYSLDMTLPKGDRGAQGLEPILQGGTTTTLNPGEQATSNLVPNGTDPATGKPIYKLDLGLPKGDQGSMATGDAKDLTVTFTEATTRTPLNSGEKMDVLFGKIKKWFSDLKTLAFTGKWGDVLEKPTTLDGYGVLNESSVLSGDIGLGKMLYRDPTFTGGGNGILKYGDSIEITRVQGIEGNPNNSGYALRIRSIGSATPSAPSLGGFTFFTQSAANKVFITRFIAKIPVGYSIGFGSNSNGEGARNEWLTKTRGTGNWTEYIFRATCGAYGTFSSTNFFYLWLDNGGVVPTPESPLDWYLSSATVYDATDPEMTLDTRYATKTELTQVDQKIEDIQVGARNLILDSNIIIDNSDYLIHNYTLSRNIEIGYRYTMSLYGELSPSKTGWGIYLGSGGTRLGIMSKVRDGLYILHCIGPQTVNGNGRRDSINIHTLTSSQTGPSRIERVKLETGDKWTDYTEAPEDITSKITNIQVGGKNLFINPGFDNDFQGWMANGATRELSWDNNRGKSLFITTTSSGQGVFQNPPRIVGNNYTTSVWMRTSGTTTSLKVIILSESTSAFKEFTLTPTWQLCTLTAPYSSTPGAICFYSRAAGNFVISNPKLERGDIYTDYQKEVSSYTTSSENLIQGTRYWVKDLSWRLPAVVDASEPRIEVSPVDKTNYLRLDQTTVNANIAAIPVTAGETISIGIDVYIPIDSLNSQYNILLNQSYLGIERTWEWVDTTPYKIPKDAWTRVYWTYTSPVTGTYSLGLRCKESNTLPSVFFKKLKISRGSLIDTGWSESPNEQQYLGGRNYIMNSTWNGGTSWWAAYLPEGAGAITIDPNGINNNNALTISRSEYTGTQRCGYQQNYYNALNQLKSLKKGVPYILSLKYKILTTLGTYGSAFVRVKNSIAGQPDVDVCRITIPTETLPGDWVYAISDVYIPPVDQELVTFYILLGRNGAFSITELMLEEATAPSGWQESDYWLLSRQNTAIKEAISNHTHLYAGSATAGGNAYGSYALYSAGQSLQTAHVNAMRYDHTLPTTAAGMFPGSNNANGALTLSMAPGNYFQQLGFSSNGRLYNRVFYGQPLTNTTIPWNELAWTSDITWANVSGKPNFSKVATSNSYDDLDNKPFIPDTSLLVSKDELEEDLLTFDERLSDTEENISNILATNPLQTYAYGIEIDNAVADYARTRIGNLSLHAQLPVQIQMRRCLLLDNGKVNYYLDENNSDLKEDGTPANLTGADGMYMVELPKHYRRFIETGTKMQAYISDLPLPGFYLVPEMYISAVEASIDRTNASLPKLASVVNTSAAFRGGNNTAAWDGTYRTLLGRPGTNTSLTNYRAYARNRGNAGMNGAGWNAYLNKAHQALYWLYAIEYANTNCQLPFNATPTDNGFKQGGLGEGVTNMSDWNGFNGTNPFVPCGTTNSLGNKTGVVSYTTKNEDGTTRDTLSVPTYRGIENPFGHIWKWTDGVKCRIQSDEAGGLSEVYTCDNPANFQDVNYDNYGKMGDIPRTEGYVKKIIGGEHGVIMPAEVGGSSNTYFCDYFYTNIPATSEVQRGVLLGGNALLGARAGLSFASTIYTVSFASAYVGSRLCFLPA